MDYKNATALDILDGMEKMFLIGEENKPIVKRDEKGRFAGTIRGAIKRGFRWVKGTYTENEIREVETGQYTYAQACLVGAAQLLDPNTQEPTVISRKHGIKFTTPGSQALDLILDELLDQGLVAQRHGEDVGIPDFNDAPNTTFEDIIKVIRAAKERFWRQ